MSTKKSRRTASDFARYRPARRWVRLTPADAIRNLREMQDMTQADVAKRAGLSQGLVSNLEHGRVRLSLSLAEKLAKALHVSPVILLFP
jgi:transcriptional regulator with XRE-family HTH domain